MSEFETLKTFGTPGVVLALGLAVLRFFGPYIRDTYLPRRAAALEKTATAMEQIADVASRLDLRLAGVETSLAEIKETGDETRVDISIICDRIGVDRRKPPKILVPGASA